jgi:hypothetical protein
VRGSTVHSINVLIEYFIQRQSPVTLRIVEISIPFLLLPPHFDKNNYSNWVELARNISIVSVAVCCVTPGKIDIAVPSLIVRLELNFDFSSGRDNVAEAREAPEPVGSKRFPENQHLDVYKPTFVKHILEIHPENICPRSWEGFLNELESILRII